MGFEKIEVWDDDIVSEHNLPNQFFRLEDLEKPKVVALCDIVKQFEGVDIIGHQADYAGEEIEADIVISAVDSIEVRRQIFTRCSSGHHYIDTRMGGETMRVFTVPRSEVTAERYIETLQEAEAVRCTQRTILYNVLVLAGLASSVVKKIVMNEQVPFCINYSLSTYQAIVEV